MLTIIIRWAVDRRKRAWLAISYTCNYFSLMISGVLVKAVYTVQ